jgi:hypothetical protein
LLKTINKRLELLEVPEELKDIKVLEADELFTYCKKNE